MILKKVGLDEHTISTKQIYDLLVQVNESLLLSENVIDNWDSEHPITVVNASREKF
jgi:hypothetical protein